jgi:1-acyl-sn-glycerol-3-phosphate acyltransferase
MENFFKKRLKKPSEKVFGLRDVAPEILLYRILPYALMEAARKYFRLQIESIDNIPRRGPAIIAPNHSGFSGFDALLLSHEIFRLTGRVPRVLTHKFWFLSQATKIPAEKIGFIEANMANGLAQLKKNNLVILFPEGASGNFKSTAKRYTLQPFKTGFIRMALIRQCPIVPTLVIGAEESHINLAELKLSKYIPGLTLPLPINLIPLPSKWKMKFLAPIHLPYKPDAVDDKDLLEELVEEVREQMQSALSDEVSRRGSAFFN